MRKLPWLLVLLASCAGHRVDLTVPAPATLHMETGVRTEARVVRVVDGDTIEVEMPATGETHDVRLIGIDTPESVSPRDPVECFGREASAATAALLDGATVTLVADVEDRDSFGRLLRYVYLGAEQANARLVANGYATAYRYPPNVRWSSLFADLERQARERGLGLWGAPTCSGTGHASSQTPAATLGAGESLVRFRQETPRGRANPSPKAKALFRDVSQTGGRA